MRNIIDDITDYSLIDCKKFEIKIKKFNL